MEKKKTPQVLAVERYDKKTARPVHLKFNAKTDAELLEHLSTISNKQGYIKALILADMAKKARGKRSVSVDYMVIL